MTTAAGADIRKDWQFHLDAFNNTIAELKLKTTIKLHIFDEHFAPFLKQHSAGVSLAAFSEQAAETGHRVFDVVAGNHNVPKDFTSVDGKRVLSALNAFNGSRLFNNETQIIVKMFQSRGRAARGIITLQEARSIWEGPVEEVWGIFLLSYLLCTLFVSSCSLV